MPALKDIDTYLANEPDNVRQALQHLRQTIKKAAPEAEEVISYSMPAFKDHGILVGFRAAKNHCSFHTWTGHTVAQFEDELKGYSLAPGTIRFTPDKPIPDETVIKIVKARLAENRTSKTSKKISEK